MVRYLKGIEPERGCGYRYIGKLYLVGTGLAIPCHRLPIEIPEECPTCGAGIKFHRGIQRIDFRELFGVCNLQEDSPCHPDCYVCVPPEGVNTWLMWVGKKFYPTPHHFVTEALALGVSKAISRLPKDFQVKRDIVFLAHQLAVPKTRQNPQTLTGYEEYFVPGIFYAFVPQRVEMLIKESDATEEKIKELEEKGIEPVVVPDNWDELVGRAKKEKKKKKGEVEKLPAEELGALEQMWAEEYDENIR